MSCVQSWHVLRAARCLTFIFVHLNMEGFFHTFLIHNITLLTKSFSEFTTWKNISVNATFIDCTNIFCCQMTHFLDHTYSTWNGMSHTMILWIYSAMFYDHMLTNMSEVYKYLQSGSHYWCHFFLIPNKLFCVIFHKNIG